MHMCIGARAYVHARVHACRYVYHRILRRHFACIARGEVRYPFFLNFAFYLVDGIIYRKKNNEIRIIYHRGRSRAFCKIYLQSSSSVLSVLLLKVRARARKICYRRFVIAVSFKSLRASYLRPSNPKGVFLADATGARVCGRDALLLILRYVILCAFTPPGGQQKRLLRLFVRASACTVILASARIPLPATQLLCFSSFLLFLSHIFQLRVL